MSFRVGVRFELGRRGGLEIKHSVSSFIQTHRALLTSCSRELGMDGVTSSS